MKNLTLNLEKQKDEELQDWLGQAILSYCTTVPFGVLVFPPSYSFMEVLKKRWGNVPPHNPLMNQLSKTKEVFFEPSGVSAGEFKNQMEQYKSKVVSSRNGCVLFGVFRGKISEGVDFKDEQARAVITVGIPNLPFGDASVVNKMEYNQQKSLLPNSHFLSGQEWYDCQAFRAINQAFGRCVRHKEDWGALILLDTRLSKYSNSQKLSKWVQQFLKIYSNPTSMNHSLLEFIRTRMPPQNAPVDTSNVRISI